MRPSNGLYAGGPPQRLTQIRAAIGQAARAVLVALAVVAGLAVGLAAFLAAAFGGIALVTRSLAPVRRAVGWFSLTISR